VVKVQNSIQILFALGIGPAALDYALVRAHENFLALLQNAPNLYFNMTFNARGNLLARQIGLQKCRQKVIVIKRERFS